MPSHPPVILCILDGVGLGLGETDDAVATARTPHLDRLMGECPWIPLQAHGTAVGLPSDGDMGNSEVGHNAMGAGRVFDQGAALVNAALESGRIFGDEWKRLIDGGTLHLIGLVSDGNVHSHVDHLNALVEQAAKDGVERLRVHVLTDGRDVGKRTALTWVEPLEERLADLRGEGRDYRIASGGGRMHITMDRYEADWDMVERGWRCHVHGEGKPFSSATEAIRSLYEADDDVDDQYLPAFVVTGDDGEPVGTIGDGDGVLFFNFRGDRAIEISRAFEEDGLDTFERGDRPDVRFAGMMQYDGDLMVPKHYLVSPPEIDQVMGEFMVRAGKRTFACSETQKFGHVTFFFNGNRSGRLDDTLETYHEVRSDTRPFDERPWMKAAEVTDACIDALHSGQYDHIRLNLANGDMVGHTGDLEATRIALECVDLQVGRLVRAARKTGAILLVTADHGNADQMFQRDKKGQVMHEDGVPMPRTSHSLNAVPFILYDPSGQRRLKESAGHGLAAIAPTVLELCGLPAPDTYVEGLLA